MTDADKGESKTAGEGPATEERGGYAGGCLCGAVRYEGAAGPDFVAHCHCDDCRKTSGTDHATHMLVAEDGFAVSGTLKFFDFPADSGSIVSRGFCPECGSPIVSRNSNMPGRVFVRVSSLDDLEIAKPQMIVYASRAPSWRPLDPALPAFPEMPPRG